MYEKKIIAHNLKASKEQIIATAKDNDNVKKYLENATVVKEIVVPGKLVSFVVK